MIIEALILLSLGQDARQDHLRHLQERQTIINAERRAVDREIKFNMEWKQAHPGEKLPPPIWFQAMELTDVYPRPKQVSKQLKLVRAYEKKFTDKIEKIEKTKGINTEEATAVVRKEVANEWATKMKKQHAKR